MPGEATNLAVKEAMVPSYGGLSITVASTGNVARDHLANERTFLSWVRTAVGTISLGLAIAKFDPTHSGLFCGSALIVLGIALLLFSVHRHSEVSRALQAGEFLILRKGAVVLVAMFCIIALVCSDAVFNATGLHHPQQPPPSPSPTPPMKSMLRRG